jgi:hypothetical protein
MTRQLHESSLETSAQNPTQLKKQIPALRLFISAFQLFSISAFTTQARPPKSDGSSGFAAGFA